ncbi:hypothetical protein SEA_PCORAL7_62 [Gordonia phage PCoral7]|uniref:Uncharacterized protein n=1 Tax=Gordonia phage Toast TaxID=2599852 RepID=A0A5J6TH09_9CAUD|nr:hypothetical protein JZX81_gp62 [Gordonia phage Toast]QFG08122.1 hypothetical protein PBI_TOAST_62 [Gordonia phage Toast]UVF60570.1 hypothetical protein SEA_PCORAL7_62 [Gordonia phage PCoral7]
MALATEPPPQLPSTTAGPDQDTGDEAYIKIRVNGLKLPNPPAKHDSITLIVKGTCYEVQDKTAADGEDRLVHLIDADSIYERGRVPIVDDKPKGLFDFVSDQRLWETAKDAAFEKGEVLDDVVTAFLRDYINQEPDDDKNDTTPGAVDDVDTKADGGKVIRPEFSDSKKDDE